MGEQLIIELAKKEIKNKHDNFMKIMAFVFRPAYNLASALFLNLTKIVIFFKKITKPS